MALPFILGLAVGAGAIVAFNKSDKLKNRVDEVVDKSKDLAVNSFQKGKEVVCDVTSSIKSAYTKEKKLEEEEEEVVAEASTKKRVRKTKPKED